MTSRAQHTVLTKVLGIQKVLCAIGFSMGGQQVCSQRKLHVKCPETFSGKAYYWAIMYPEFVQK
jgi:homoserine acetyltransferase